MIALSECVMKNRVNFSVIDIKENIYNFSFRFLHHEISFFHI